MNKRRKGYDSCYTDYKFETYILGNSFRQVAIWRLMQFLPVHTSNEGKVIGFSVQM